MSLRRSTRVTSSIASNPKPDKEVAKYSKIAAAAPAPNKRKARTSATTPQDNAPTNQTDDIITSLPATPLPKKRQRITSASPTKPPFTPTPSAINLITSSTALAPPSSPIKPSDPSPVKRRKAKEALAPDVGLAKPGVVNVDTLLKDAEAYLVSVDPKLKRLVERHTCAMFSPEGLREGVDVFAALVGGVIGQQVSGAAAASIRKKFTSLFPQTHPSFPTPAQVSSTDLPTLRTAGLSQRKAEYISGLAHKFSSGELSAEMLINASDEELIEKLVAVRGLGRWSVEMFACFGLKRMDVFSTGDLGVQRGMATYIGRDTSKLKAKGGKWKYMTEKEMLDLASKFSPYRSLFMWYMWRIEDVDVSVLQQ